MAIFIVHSGDLFREIESKNHRQAIIDAFDLAGKINLGVLTAVLLKGETENETLFFSTALFFKEKPKLRIIE